MVLEQSLEFYEPDEAKMVAGALRGDGIPVRVVRRDATIQSTEVIGSIRNFRAAIEEGLSQIEEDDKAYPWLKNILVLLEEKEEGAAEFLKQYPPGETITSVIPEESLSELYQSLWAEEADEDEVERVVAEYLRIREVFILFEQSGKVRRTEDGELILDKQIEPGDLITSFSGRVIDEVGSEILKKHGIKTRMIIMSDPRFRLEFSVEAISMIKITDLDELVSDMDIEFDEYDEFRNDVYAKRTAMMKIGESLKGRGVVTAREIFDHLQTSTFELSGEIEELALDLDFDFVKGLLDDMRKIGMLRKKGAGYRLV